MSFREYKGFYSNFQIFTQKKQNNKIKQVGEEVGVYRNPPRGNDDFYNDLLFQTDFFNLSLAVIMNSDNVHPAIHRE